MNTSHTVPPGGIGAPSPEVMPSTGGKVTDERNPIASIPGIQIIVFPRGYQSRYTRNRDTMGQWVLTATKGAGLVAKIPT
jgi:hypothetical protein